MEDVLDDITNLYMKSNSFEDDFSNIKHLETFKFLIKKFPKILEYKHSYTAESLFQLSMLNTNLEIITYLIENYPNLVIIVEKNILFNAINNKNVNCVKYLFKKFPYLILEKYKDNNIVTKSHLCDKKVITFLMNIIPDLFLNQINNIVNYSQMDPHRYVTGNKNIRKLYPIFSKIPESINDKYVRDTLIDQKINVWINGKREEKIIKYTKSIFSENTLILPLTFQIDN